GERFGAVIRMRRLIRRVTVLGSDTGGRQRPGPRSPCIRPAAAGQAAPPAAGIRMSRTTTAFLFACMLMLAPAHALADAGPEPRPPGAAIASAHALATEAGFETLRAGGNAFDAAVTVSAVLSVVEPISSGLGGGGFFLLHDAGSGRDVFVDARETSPAAA